MAGWSYIALALPCLPGVLATSNNFLQCCGHSVYTNVIFHFIIASYLIFCKSFLILTTSDSNSSIVSCKLVWNHLSFLLVETVVLVKYLRSS